VYDPIGGLGTTGVIAIKLGQQAYLTKLRRVYFHNLMKYCRDAEEVVNTPALFDLRKYEMEEK
jgi:DNA modification methylase